MRLHTRAAAYLVMAAVLILLVAPTAGGEDLTGTGPDFPMSPGTSWVSIEPGEYQWYVFDYKEKAKNQPMVVKIFSDPPESVNLTIRNCQQADLWRSQGKHVCFGCCTPVTTDADKDGKADYAQWAGKIGANGTYYMVAEHAKNMTGTANYRIEISGEGYTLREAPAPVEAPAAPVVEAAKPVTMLGGGPDEAMALTTEPQTIQPGEYQWFYFDYSRDSKKKDEDLRNVEIKLFSEPPGVAVLTIRNGDNANAWRRDGTHESFGACTCANVDRDKDNVSDYGIWCGRLCASGRYYVVIEHSRNSTVPATYRLEISGL